MPPPSAHKAVQTAAQCILQCRAVSGRINAISAARKGAFLLNKAILVFVIFSFLGWLWESVYCTVCRRKWANRGFLYGPVCPIYGFGCVAGYFTYNAIESGALPELTVWQIFLVGFVVSMILEYPTSWALEKLFNARWWDYSNVPLNINGRTSVPTSLAFGGGAVLVMKWVIPFAVSLLDGVSDWAANLAALLIIALLSADLTLTVSALTDFQRLVTQMDDAFQNHMTNTVYQIMESQNHFARKAVGRIQVFRHPIRGFEKAQKERKEKFSELIRRYNETPEFNGKESASELEHGKNVAWVSFLINERLNLNADEKELVEAAMLHDFGRGSGKSAGEDGAESSVRSHMWPIKKTEIPKSKEERILRLADKYCALVEMLRVGR